MYKLACVYLAIPFSSMPTKEANSKAQYHFEDRDQLQSCTFKAKLCIRAWLSLLDSANIITMREDFNVAYDTLKRELEDMIT